jgi:sortase A
MLRSPRQRYRKLYEELVVWLKGPMTKRDFHDFRSLACAAGNHLMKLKPYLRAEFRTRLKAESLEAQIRAAYQALKPRVRARLVQFSEGSRRLSERFCRVAIRRRRRIAWAGACASFLLAFVVFGGLAILLPRIFSEVRGSRPRLTRAQNAINLKRYLKYSLRIAEFALWILAASTLGYCGYAYASAAVYQTHQKAAFEDLPAQRAARAASFLSSATLAGAPEPNSVLGILEIPSIGVTSIVEGGVDSKTLLRSVGHIPGTALPGAKGNAGLAAHRDTYFRDLGKLAPGDVLTYRSVSRTYHYAVRTTGIVDPTDTHVLSTSATPTRTLVTCYPFHYVGNAPKRFIVVAQETDSRQ